MALGSSLVPELSTHVQLLHQYDLQIHASRHYFAPPVTKFQTVIKTQHEICRLSIWNCVVFLLKIYFLSSLMSWYFFNFNRILMVSVPLSSILPSRFSLRRILYIKTKLFALNLKCIHKTIKPCVI